MKKLLIFLLLILFVVNKEIKCQPNEVLDKQIQKCKKVCVEGKVFNSDTLSCELYSTNITCPEGQIFNNHTSSCEEKKVDTTKENGDGITQDGNDTTQDDDPHELVYNIKLKETKKTLRKLEDEKQRIFITINGTNGASAKYLNGIFFDSNKPKEVYLNNNKDINYYEKNTITLNKDGENIIEVVWKDKLTSLTTMFYMCNSIVSLDLSHLDTSNVQYMNEMFRDCSSLVSLDLSNFNTSNVQFMIYMFGDCSSLASLDLSSFNTSNVKNMQSMFNGCSSLELLDLSNFKTSNVLNIFEMFKGCSSLVSLDLSNFNTINVEIMGYMFSGCSSLQYINLFNYLGKDIFAEISKNNNLSICINDFEQINNGSNSLKNNNIN